MSEILEKYINTITLLTYNMVKILHTGKQFVITLSPDLIKRMGWKKGTDLLVSKVPDKDLLYIEEMPKKKRK